MARYSYNIIKGGIKVIDFFSSFYLGKEKINYFRFNKGSILVNNKEVDINYILNANDKLVLITNEKLDTKPLKKKINIIYEDEYYLIINKPINILVHSDGAQNLDNTLVNALTYYYQNKGYDFPVRYCHRLDKDTSGLMIFVKDPLTESYIKALIEKRELHRTYLALVEGIIDKNMTINKPIGRNRHINGKYMVSPTGKEAITMVESIKCFKKYSLVSVSLKTGRTHQIRVHLSSIGHPILGDTLYGGATSLIKRQALHSHEVTFINPHNGKNYHFIAPLPFDMNTLVKE